MPQLQAEFYVARRRRARRYTPLGWVVISLLGLIFVALVLILIAAFNQGPRSRWDDTFGRMKGEAEPVPIQRERATPRDTDSGFSKTMRELQKPLKPR